MGASYHNDTSLPIRDYRPVPIKERPEHEANRNPKLPVHHIDAPDGSVVQDQHVPSPNVPAPVLNFDGIPFPGVTCNCAPPDTNGEVGLTQYVQMVNTGFQVFNKSTGASVFGPVAISSVWTGFGGPCEFAGDGDPVVLYDQIADRWLLSQFADNGITVTDECVAVSTTSDATGPYNRYGFHLSENFNDYPHLSVWPDGYYMSVNVFNQSGTAFLGVQPFAFDRSKMLAGLAATFVSTGLLPGGPNEDPILPSDLDGSTLPPAGAPNSFVEFPGTVLAYKVWHMHSDFVTPANTTFTLFASPAAAPYTALCPVTRNCVPQLGSTANLDGIGDRFMFRMAYRNFGTHESVVGNYSVSSGGVAGIRWIELRDVTSGPVTLFQESTYQPDTTWRWMGSVAMDVQGNMMLGFSASSASINPQIRYAGRLVTDPINSLSQGEGHLFDGTGSQLDTVNRWGDYSDMTIDPVDDCTFWYTQEYYATTSSFNWRTRIGNFKFPGCAIGTPTPTVTGTRTDTPTLTPTPTATNTPTATPTPCAGDQYTITAGTDTIVAGTTDIGNHCDDCDTLIAIPFPFTLYNSTFNNVNVSSNGRLDFMVANEPGGFITNCLPAPPNVGPYDFTIFPLWHDQRTDVGLSGCANFGASGCGVFTSTSGVAPNRIFNIEWRTVRFANNAQTENYEVRLYEASLTKQFDVIYGATNGITASDTGGVQGNAAAGFFTQDFCNTTAPANVSRSYTSAGCVTPTPTITGTRTVTPTFTPTPCQTSWQIEANMPVDLYGAAGASDGTYVYEAGGYSFSLATTLNVFNRYDPVANTWSALAPMPGAAIMASAVYYPTTNKIFVFGGEDAVTGINSNATRIYDIATNTWSAGANMPDVRSFMASGYNSANGKIYLVSGYNTGQVTSAQPNTWEYDPVANSFNTAKAPIPHATGGAASGIINGHLYVAGGRDALNAVINLTWDYNISTDTWTARANMPVATNVPGSAAAGGQLQVFGSGNPFGPSNHQPGPDTAATGLVYDPGTDTWANAPNLNVARSFVSGTWTGSKLVAVGGYNGATTVATTEARPLTCAPPTDTPTNTPTNTPTPTPTPACASPCSIAPPPAPIMVTNCAAPPVTTSSSWTQINLPGSDVVLRCALNQLPGTTGVRILAHSILVDGPNGGSVNSTGTNGTQLIAGSGSGQCNSSATVDVESASVVAGNPNGGLKISACGDIVLNNSAINGTTSNTAVTSSGGRVCAFGDTMTGSQVFVTANGDLTMHGTTVTVATPSDTIKLISTAGSVLAGGGVCLPNRFTGGNDSNMTVTANGIVDLSSACVEIAQSITVTAGGAGFVCATDAIINVANAEIRNDFGQKGLITMTACGGAGRIEIGNAILVDNGKNGGGDDPNRVSNLNGSLATIPVNCAATTVPTCTARPLDAANNPVSADPANRAAHNVTGVPRCDT